jgi:hypothetical protein
LTQKTRAEITAETRIAKGIARLYQKYAPPADAYDAQGIATIYISENEFKKDKECITAHFPNKLKHGITLHFFRLDFIQHPPIRYMITEKVRSLYSSADSDLPPNLENEIFNRLYEIILDARAETLIATSKSLEIVKFDLDQEKMRDQLIHKKADLLMQEFIGKALHDLYECRSQQYLALSYEQFAKQLIAHTQQHLDDATDILTFNEEARCFSYEEAPEHTTKKGDFPEHTSKKRGFDENCSNLGLVCEGRYSLPNIEKEITTKITVSFIKHASLAPIDEITHIHLFDRNQSDLRVLLKSCELMEEVVKKMIRLRPHSKLPGKDILTIDWNYQLLSQSGFNIEKQATTYGYIIQAALLTSGAEFKVDGNTATANINVMNSEAMRFGHWGIGYKKDTQRRENRKTYLHLTQAIDGINFPDYKQDEARPYDHPSSIQNRLYQQAEALKTRLSTAIADQKDLQNIYIKLLGELKSNARKFSKFRKSYSYDAISTNAELLQTARTYIKNAKETNDHIRKVTYQIEQIHLKNWKKNRKSITALRTKIQETIESNKHKIDIDEQPFRDILIKISALFYKSYMDELYYSNNYRGQTHGALFNGYCAAYQHLTGSMASIGCKTALNRTYVVRLVVAALQGRSILPLNTVPAPHSPLDKILDGHAMSNAALFSRISYTAGGTPEVDLRRFPILNNVKNIHFFSTFWRYSAQLLHKIISKIKKFFTALTKQNNTKAVAQPPKKGSTAQIIIPTLQLPNVPSTQSLAASSTQCDSNRSSPSPLETPASSISPAGSNLSPARSPSP